MSNSKLYVGNLSFQTTEGELKTMFEQSGSVESVSIVTDRETGRSRGFGFVEMDSETSALAAIDKLNGQSMQDRSLVVNAAKPREEKKPSYSSRF